VATLRFRDDTLIGDDQAPYIIAEVNSSHNGNVETAKKMIDAAVKAGCSCVKFQSWTPETLYSRSYYDKNPIAARIVKKMSLSESELQGLSQYCKASGVGYSSTPYAEDEVDFLLEKCNAPFIKVASMDINNLPFLEYIGATGAPIILSTGMADIDEIQQAISIIEKTGNTKLALLHCISIYPAAPETIHLNNIPMLKALYPNYPIGFSDHTLGIEVAGAAIALGSLIIEKHLTLDRSRMGMDNNMAIEPDEMEELVKNCNTIKSAMGSYARVVSNAELQQRNNMRRSIIAKKDLKAGTILKKEDLYAKRPGTGFAPDQYSKVIGKELIKDVESDTLISSECIKAN
jgi:sialic acid synthase SpsE